MSTRHIAARPTAGSGEITRLIDQLERAYAGDAWLGMPVRELLSGVAAGAAAAHPIAGGHRIWELVTHITYWLDDSDLDGPVPGHASTRYVLVHGVLQHTLYHAGQIGLLKRAARR